MEILINDSVIELLVNMYGMIVSVLKLFAIFCYVSFKDFLNKKICDLYAKYKAESVIEYWLSNKAFHFSFKEMKIILMPVFLV